MESKLSKKFWLYIFSPTYFVKNYAGFDKHFMSQTWTLINLDTMTSRHKVRIYRQTNFMANIKVNAMRRCTYLFCVCYYP